MERRRAARRWALAGVTAVSAALLAGASSPAETAARPAARCPTQLVGGKRVCLRAGQRCRVANRSDYLLFGLDCVRRRGRRVLAKATIAALRGPHVFLYDSRGLPSLPDALQAFDDQIAPLPGVRHRPGAVGVGESGTPVISALVHYRSRLSNAQRAVLDHVLSAHASAAAVLPKSGEFAAMRDEALRRLQAHGLRFTHAIGLAYDPKNDGETLAYTAPRWLLGTGNDCLITITPQGLGGPVEDRQASMVHELVHCAQAEAVSTAAQWSNVPDWIGEGTANWAAAEVTSEWSRVPGYLADWWRKWLDQPESDLFKRDYDAMGFFALAQHEGANMFALIQPLNAEGGAGSSLAVLGGLLSAFPSLTTAWGPTLATQPALGTDWDLAGPGDPRRDPPSVTIADGSDWSHTVSARGAYATRLQLSAQIIKVDLGDPQIEGRLRTPDGNDHALTSAKYTTVEGGAECPDGTKLPYPVIPAGRAYLGFADTQRPAAVGVEGLSVENLCEKLGKVPKPPNNDACRVLNRAGVAGIVGPGMFAFHYLVVLRNGGRGTGCIYVGEDSSGEPNGEAASLTLGRYPVSNRKKVIGHAERFLQQMGYRLIRLAGADVAGIRHEAKGAIIQLVVGSTSAAVVAGPEDKTRALAHGVIAALR